MSNEYDKMIFAGNLTRYMMITNITAAEVARRMGVSEAIVSSWKHGVKMPRMDKIEILSRILGCEIDELICEGKNLRIFGQLTDGALELARQYDLLDERDQAFVAGQVSALLAQEKYHTGGAGSSASGE